MIRLDIISDPICPWCYIGKNYLDRALEKHPDHPFEIEWHPYQLNPDMPVEGMERRAYLEGKFGGKQEALSVYSRIEKAATEVGLNINWEGIKRTPNTHKAHRLIHWAGLEKRQTFVIARLFDGYFNRGLDIGDETVLAGIGEACGMDKAMILRLFSSSADADDITARDKNSRAKGVSGVPTFIVANQHVLTGAQPPELWAQVIEEISAQIETPDQAPGSDLN